ncbi:protein NEGATIVE REGULATOR OF RESISTANCE-like [Syzygium oleosum]|uniref:protein NEGATIVE REGULATOR OF RESISTANCE-like n=1 Tax=Syzygium oleosum TaxID=219896 RepID=UPI0011D1B9E2|nr:protein NEGATIVE REGULATOR OF RESISTANCE-like [Syzygium oleosum]
MDRRRKREDDGGASVGKKRPKGPESSAEGEQAEVAATDEEVEEFFTILRRIHAAVRYFEKGKRGEGSRRLTLSELEALPEEEEEEDDDGAPRRSDDPGLDLNCEPSSEANAASGL